MLFLNKKIRENACLINNNHMLVIERNLEFMCHFRNANEKHLSCNTWPLFTHHLWLQNWIISLRFHIALSRHSILITLGEREKASGLFVRFQNKMCLLPIRVWEVEGKKKVSRTQSDFTNLNIGKKLFRPISLPAM